MCLWGGNGYTYTLPVGITGLFSSAMQCGNKNTQNSSLKKIVFNLFLSFGALHSMWDLSPLTRD